MLYTNAEIELLKLCAWCRDLPAASTFLNKENLRALTAAGQLRISRNGQSVRITESGKHTLDTLGLHFDYYSKSRGMGNYLIRRLNTANLMLFFFGGKTDVFCSCVPDRNSPFSYAFIIAFNVFCRIFRISLFGISLCPVKQAVFSRIIISPIIFCLLYCILCI